MLGRNAGAADAGRSLRTGRGAPPPAIDSKGFGSRNSEYSFLAAALVARVHVVVSIQQDLPGDAPMTSGSNLAVMPRPARQTGADTLPFAISHMVAADARTLEGSSW